MDLTGYFVSSESDSDVLKVYQNTLIKIHKSIICKFYYNYKAIDDRLCISILVLGDVNSGVSYAYFVKDDHIKTLSETDAVEYIKGLIELVIPTALKRLYIGEKYTICDNDYNIIVIEPFNKLLNNICNITYNL